MTHFSFGKRNICALLLALALAGALSGRCLAAESDRGSLRVRTDLSDYGLSEDQLLVDLYLVGTPGAAGYEAAEGFRGLDLVWTTNAGAAELADQAADRALEGLQPLVQGSGSDGTLTRTDAGDPLEPGLYLLLLRGADLTEYAKRSSLEGLDRWITLAESETHQFSFLPILLIYDAQGPMVVSPKVAISPKEGSEEEELPDTGQRWRPVNRLALLGGSLIAVGFLLRRKNKDEA